MAGSCTTSSAASFFRMSIRPLTRLLQLGNKESCAPPSHYQGLRNVYGKRQNYSRHKPLTVPRPLRRPPSTRRSYAPFPGSTGARRNLGQHEAVLRGLCQRQPAPYPVHVPAQPQVPHQGQVRMTLKKNVFIVIYNSQVYERGHSSSERRIEEPIEPSTVCRHVTPVLPTRTWTPFYKR